MNAVARPRGNASVQLELHLESFDGPLELLLLLIEQRRLPITQVSLAQVADQYLAQVHALPALDADLLADFLVIGSKLLLLKSRALLLTEEPDPEVEEVATDLERVSVALPASDHQRVSRCEVRAGARSRARSLLRETDDGSIAASGGIGAQVVR